MEPRLDYWEMGRLLTAFGKMLQEIPGSTLKACELTSEDALYRVTADIKAAMTKLEEFQKQFNAIDEKIYNQSEESWKRVQEARAVFEWRLNRLEWPNVNFGYGIKETVEVAERLAHLTDKQWGRVIELAKAFAQRETS